jgi:hypothetical protein
MHPCACVRARVSERTQIVEAAHCGIAVLGLAMITNQCKGPDDDFPNPTHEEVLASSKIAARWVLTVRAAAPPPPPRPRPRLRSCGPASAFPLHTRSHEAALVRAHPWLLQPLAQFGVCVSVCDVDVFLVVIPAAAPASFRDCANALRAPSRTFALG